MTTGYCQCGCGGVTRIATRTRSQLQMVKGKPLRYIDGHGKIGRLGAYKKHRHQSEDCGYETPCWIWQLSLSHKGYGWEWDNERGRMVAAHILAWERTYGAVPSGMELDHLCFQRACVNPDHLEAVTHAENIARSAKRGLYKAGSHNARKTHCPKGHPYSAENTYVSKGTRSCKTCVSEYHRRRNAARRTA